MDRLPYDVCKIYYDALGLSFEEKFDKEQGRWYGNNAQLEVLKGDDRFPIVIGGERGGKSFVTAAMMIPHMLALPIIRYERFHDENGKLKFNWTDRTDRPLSPDFVIFGPNYAEPRVEFTYIEEWLRKLDEVARVSKPTEGAWRLITKSGVVLSTWSTDNPMSIRGIDLEGALAAEAGNMEWDAIERIQGRIGAKRGFCFYNGTMENAKQWYVKWAMEGKRQNRFNVVTYSIPSWSNKHEFPGGREDPEIKRWESFYTDDVFMTRVAAEPQPPRYRVLKEFTHDHIKTLKIPRKPDGSYDATFEIWIDPGYQPSAYAVLWVAWWETDKGRYFYVFDEFYEQEVETTAMIERIKKHKMYKYIANDGIVIDISAKRHSDGNEPALMIYKKLTGKQPYMKYWHENASIERIRTTARSGMIAIHPNCMGLIAEIGLGDYPRFPEMHPWKFPTARDGTIVGEKPVDAWNHSAKALAYGLLRRQGLVERMGDRPKPWNRIYENNPKRKSPKKSYLRTNNNVATS